MHQMGSRRMAPAGWLAGEYRGFCGPPANGTRGAVSAVHDGSEGLVQTERR